MFSSRFLPRHRFPCQVSTIPCVFLSSLLPRSNLNWFSRDRCERTSIQHRSTAPVIDRMPFVLPRNLSRDRPITQIRQICRTLSYTFFLKLKPRACNWTRKERFCWNIYQNKYKNLMNMRCNATKSFDILAISLSVVDNYLMVP